MYRVVAPWVHSQVAKTILVRDWVLRYVGPLEPPVGHSTGQMSRRKRISDMPELYRTPDNQNDSNMRVHAGMK
jgi:hypothetical protein